LKELNYYYLSHDISAGIATRYGLEGRVSLPGKRFSVLHIVQTGSGGLPNPLSNEYGGFSPEVKWPGVKLTSHLTEVKNDEVLFLFSHTS
jgi:hypothetical protein